jgi:hypothetical protein
MEININSKIKCRLTVFGETILKNKNPVSYEFNYNKETRELNEQLWEVMNTFGGEFYNGGHQIIAKNLISCI